MSSNRTENNPSQPQTDDRDALGRFTPGNSIGKQFQPGESGNPGGMPEGTAQPGRWLRSLADATPDDLRSIVDDPKASAAKIGAARLLLDLADAEGTPESRRRALAELLDRCEGRPRQAVDVSGDLRAASVVYQITVESGDESGATDPEPDLLTATPEIENVTDSNSKELQRPDENGQRPRPARDPESGADG